MLRQGSGKRGASSSPRWRTARWAWLQGRYGGAEACGYKGMHPFRHHARTPCAVPGMCKRRSQERAHPRLQTVAKPTAARVLTNGDTAHDDDQHVGQGGAAACRGQAGTGGRQQGEGMTSGWSWRLPVQVGMRRQHPCSHAAMQPTQQAWVDQPSRQSLAAPNSSPEPP